MNFLEPRIHSLLPQKGIATDVLRLDEIHRVVSGNKWYKLKYYLKEAMATNKKAIVTFGGAFSNHIVATAAACAEAGLESAGIIRGERPKILSPSLVDAIGYGMDLFYISREDYRNKTIPQNVYETYRADELYVVNEGGYGLIGAKGASEILTGEYFNDYTHFITAVGTGTTLAGLGMSLSANQQVMGISVLKNNFELEAQVQALLRPEKHGLFTILHDYHFGGYAKFNADLIRFMNEWYERTSIPSDFVYTGKLFYAVNDLILKRYFPEGSRLLVIHSGGLQGNRSLGKGTLIF